MASTSAHAERAKILERAVAVIESGGEGSVRVVDIAKHVGVAVTTLFHHFGTREQLLEAAQVERYVRDLGTTIEELEVATALAAGHEDFRGLMLRFVRGLLASSAEPARRSRLSVSGDATLDPRLASVVGNAHHSLCTGLANVLERAIGQRWIEPSLDPLATAHWIVEMLFARGFNEIGQQSFDRRAWDDLVLRSVLRTLFND